MKLKASFVFTIGIITVVLTGLHADTSSPLLVQPGKVTRKTVQKSSPGLQGPKSFSQGLQGPKSLPDYRCPIRSTFVHKDNMTMAGNWWGNVTSANAVVVSKPTINMDDDCKQIKVNTIDFVDQVDVTFSNSLSTRLKVSIHIPEQRFAEFDSSMEALISGVGFVFEYKDPKTGRLQRIKKDGQIVLGLKKTNVTTVVNGTADMSYIGYYVDFVGEIAGSIEIDTYLNLSSPSPIPTPMPTLTDRDR